jgi:hypothetical protein
MRVFTRRFWIALRYRLGVLGVCLAYLLAALEIPLPVFVHKISSQPFPCQDHACGCQTAEQCWSHCCCFSPEERWAWAKAHNVELPAYAEKPTDSRAATVRERQQSRSLTVAAQPSSTGWNTVKLRDRDNDTTAKNCCCCTHKKTETQAKENSDTSRLWVTMMTAWRCQGYSTLWTSTGTVLPVLPLAALLPDCPPPALVCLLSVRADRIPSIPPDPPPRPSLV